MDFILPSGKKVTYHKITLGDTIAVERLDLKPDSIEHNSRYIFQTVDTIDGKKPTFEEFCSLEVEDFGVLTSEVTKEKKKVPLDQAPPVGG